MAMLVILLLAGLAVNFALAERAPSLTARRRAGAVVAACVALVPIALLGSLALSERGLGGSISKAWNDLTDPAASTPANDPTRLTAIGSVRARYWNEALQIWEANPAVGVGAGGYRTVRPRYRDDTLNVRHAHGYLVQTMSDLGLVGLAISLALLAAWLAGAARTTGPWRGPFRATFTPERIGLLTMCAVVVVFGVHSLIDWTWFVPGNVVPALLCAGWVAGRGPLTEPVGVRRPWRERLRLSARRPAAAGGAVAAVAVAVLAAWTTYGPQGSVNAANDGLEALEAGRVPEARADIRRARDADPLSTNPLYAGSTVELSAGNTEGARRLLEQAVRLHPSTAEPWLRLAQFELDHGRPRAALRRIGPALYLDPRSATVQATWLEASREETARRDAAADGRRRSGKGRP
jgi:tetratricopeptide (TPR) repeat protein